MAWRLILSRRGRDGLPAAETDIGLREIAEALVVAGMVVTLDGRRNTPFKVTDDAGASSRSRR